ncbi:MAG TPA: UdgX family uracil-DNA binding protein [Acidimicrobiales bacterium]|nr:UdgX family uracil-DNA binding protein [Acidimicrobiales bacterium]
MGAEAFLPNRRDDLAALRTASAGCQGCGLFAQATQTVFGDGNPHASVMLVGEQPGDQEDITGEPFVGPAGTLLDRALAEAGIDRGKLYITNAVKHFKWEPKGKIRLHKKPGAREVTACKPWVLAEIDAVRPEFILCLGATAAQSLLSPDFRVTRQRGQILEGPRGTPVSATVHPSSILRVRDESERATEMARFVEDLRMAVDFER